MKSVDIARIKQIAQDERIELQGRVDESNLIRNLEEDLIVFDDANKNLHKSNDWTDTYRLFKDLEQLTLKARKKGWRYTKGQIQELKMILEKYPTKHQVIRKSLKIPMSSFQNLKKEMNGDINDFKSPKSRLVDKINLTTSEKKYIKRLLKPPAYPSSIKEI